MRRNARRRAFMDGLAFARIMSHFLPPVIFCPLWGKIPGFCFFPAFHLN
jgi:hypothetical protein